MSKNDYLFQRLERFSSIVENVILKINRNQKEYIEHFEHISRDLSRRNTEEVIEFLREFKGLIEELKEFQESITSYLERCYEQ
tara:strand:+ start:308 stop:556 length:249 start_codon:yes stop_codon:yes gene_type:complete